MKGVDLLVHVDSYYEKDNHNQEVVVHETNGIRTEKVLRHNGACEVVHMDFPLIRTILDMKEVVLAFLVHQDDDVYNHQEIQY
jgi:hypothetical protein